MLIPTGHEPPSHACFNECDDRRAGYSGTSSAEGTGGDQQGAFRRRHAGQLGSNVFMEESDSKGVKVEFSLGKAGIYEWAAGE